jgi:hypothetical protein
MADDKPGPTERVVADQPGGPAGAPSKGVTTDTESSGTQGNTVEVRTLGNVTEFNHTDSGVTVTSDFSEVPADKLSELQESAAHHGVHLEVRGEEQ